jgi:tetratricopeptide (TPR) repeat protein
MQFRNDFESLEDDDPLVRAMLAAEGAGGLSEVAKKIEQLDSEADAANFLEPPTVIAQTDTKSNENASHASLRSISNVGPYVLIRQIGQGGFGRVFEGFHRDLPGRKVAVKVFKNRWLDDIQRLEIERRVLQTLKHPSLVTAVDAGEEVGGTTYLVMNLVNGIRIDEFVRSQQPGFPEIAKLFQQVAEAMEYAHQQDVVHRDLKPGNILITHDGVPVVTDFGLAKRLNLEGGHSLTATGVLMGTLGYLAPEQADPKRGEVTRSVDVYGLGATLYQVLTGQAPFERQNLLQALDELRTQLPTTPRALNPEIPSDLERICLKCLAKSPQDRYESMQALADDLQRFIAGRPVAARPPRLPQRLWRWCRANPVVGGLSIGLGVAVLSGLVASTILWRQAARQQTITGNLLAEAVKLSQSDDEAAETMLVQTPDTLEYRYQRLLNSVEFLDGSIQTFPDDDMLFRESATAHFRLGKVCCRQAKYEEGQVAYQTALSRFRELAEAYPEDDTLKFDVFHCLLGLNEVDREFMKIPPLEEGKLAEAYEIIQRLVATNPKNTDYRDALICTQLQISNRRYPVESPKIVEFLEGVYKDAIELKSQFPEPCLQWRYVGGTADRLASLYLELGDPDQAKPWLQIAFKEIREFITRPDLDPRELMDLAGCFVQARRLELQKGNLEEADDYARQWREFVEQCATKYPDYYVFRDALERSAEFIGDGN